MYNQKYPLQMLFQKNISDIQKIVLQSPLAYTLASLHEVQIVCSSDFYYPSISQMEIDVLKCLAILITRLIYDDVTAIKVILFILVVSIFTFLLFGVGVEIVLFLYLYGNQFLFL